MEMNNTSSQFEKEMERQALRIIKGQKLLDRIKVAAVVCLSLAMGVLYILVASNASAHEGCNPVTFYGCNAEYRIAAQQKQFQSREGQKNNSFRLLRSLQVQRENQNEYQRLLAKARAQKARAKRNAFARHEDARKTKGKTSFLTQTSDGTWVQTEINRGKRRQ